VEQVLSLMREQGLWLADENRFAVGCIDKDTYIVQHFFSPNDGREFYRMMVKEIEQGKVLFFTYRDPESWSRGSDLKMKTLGYLCEVVEGVDAHS